MKRDRKRPLDAAAAQRLLAGDAGGSAYLAGLIAAATAPPDPSELTGEDAAVAFFVAVRDGAVLRASARPESPAGSRPVLGVRRPRWGRLVPIRAAALGLALVLAVGGLAVAAGAGVLPGLRPVDAPSAGPTGRPQATLHSPTQGGTGAGDSTAGPGDSAAPRPSLDGLCHAYLAQVASDHDKAHQNPAFAALFTAAGGVDQATGFCETQLASAGGGPTPTPEVPRPHPTGPPSPHTTGGPDHPDHPGEPSPS